MITTRYTALFVLLFAVAFTPSLAQEQPASAALHPIDSAYAECLAIEENQTTYGMIECAGRAYEAWDAELNRMYKQLMGALQPAEKEKLKAAQRNWLAWRNSEAEFSGLMHNNLGGSMWRIVAAERATAIVKQRALELQAYYETMVEAR